MKNKNIENEINDLHPKTEKYMTRTGNHRYFNPIVCEQRDWVLGPEGARALYNLVSQETIDDVCHASGARAIRDVKSGKIVEYSAPGFHDEIL